MSDTIHDADVTSVRPSVPTSGASLADVLEAFVREAGAFGPDEPIDHDAHLFDEGYLDSLGTLALIEHLEAQTGRPIANEVLMDPRFASISGIVEVLVA